MASESIKGRTALVTGAAKRLGRAIAMALASEGANIVVHYARSRKDAEEVCNEIERTGVRAWPFQGDFDDPQGHVGVIERAQAIAGPIHMLVNNASAFPEARLRDLSFDDLVNSLRTNAWAPFDLCRQMAAQEIEAKIVNMLDARLRGYDWRHVGYIISKSVLELLTRMLALELAPKVTVNAIAPGLVLPPPGQDESYLQQLAKSLPLQRHGDAQDIADAAVYLLRSTFLTGQVIYVDGGRHVREYGDGSNPD